MYDYVKCTHMHTCTLLVDYHCTGVLTQKSRPQGETFIFRKVKSPPCPYRWYSQAQHWQCVTNTKQSVHRLNRNKLGACRCIHLIMTSVYTHVNLGTLATARLPRKTTLVLLFLYSCLWLIELTTSVVLVWAAFLLQRCLNLLYECTLYSSHPWKCRMRLMDLKSTAFLALECWTSLD